MNLSLTITFSIIALEASQPSTGPTDSQGDADKNPDANASKGKSQDEEFEETKRVLKTFEKVEKNSDGRKATLEKNNKYY